MSTFDSEDINISLDWEDISFLFGKCWVGLTLKQRFEVLAFAQKLANLQDCDAYIISPVAIAGKNDHTVAAPAAATVIETVAALATEVPSEPETASADASADVSEPASIDASADVSEPASIDASADVSEPASIDASADVSEPASIDASADVSEDAFTRYCNKVFDFLKRLQSPELLSRIGTRFQLDSSLKKNFSSLKFVLLKDGRFKETTLNGAKAIELVSESDKDSRFRTLENAARAYEELHKEDGKKILWLLCDSEKYECTGKTCCFVHLGEQKMARHISGLPMFRTLCKSGKNCKYGLNCKNVHLEMGDHLPEKKACRFGDKCCNPDCNFDHPANHVPAVAAVAKRNKNEIPCRDGDDCKNDQCHYDHKVDPNNNTTGSTSGTVTIADHIANWMPTHVSADDWNPDDDGINGSANAPVS
jgi:hypothetical protein